MALAHSADCTVPAKINTAQRPPRRRDSAGTGFEGTLRELAAARMRHEDLRTQGASLAERVASLEELYTLRARMAAYHHFGA